MNLQDAIRIVTADQSEGWWEEHRPTSREAVEAARDGLTVDPTNVVPGSRLVELDAGHEEEYEAYKLVLNATDEEIEAALAGREPEPTPMQITIEDAPQWRDADVEVHFIRRVSDSRSYTETVALTNDDLQELHRATQAKLAARGAADLPEDSVVASETVAYIKNHPTPDLPWRGTNGGYFTDRQVDVDLDLGAQVLRVGTGKPRDEEASPE